MVSGQRDRGALRIQRAYWASRARQLRRKVCSGDGNATAQKKLAIVLKRQGNYGDAATVLKDIIESGNDSDSNGTLRVMLSECEYQWWCREGGDDTSILTHAEECLLQGLKRGWMVHQEGFLHLAHILIAQGSHAKALTILIKHIEMFTSAGIKSDSPKRATFQKAVFLSAALLKQSRMYEEAIQYLFKFIDDPPKGLCEDTILFEIAVLYEHYMHSVAQSQATLAGRQAKALYSELQRLRQMCNEAKYAAFSCYSTRAASLHATCRAWFLDPNTHAFYANEFIRTNHFIFARDALCRALDRNIQDVLVYANLAKASHISGDARGASDAAQAAYVASASQANQRRLLLWNMQARLKQLAGEICARYFCISSNRRRLAMRGCFAAWIASAKSLKKLKAMLGPNDVRRYLRPAFNAWKMMPVHRRKSTLLLQMFSRGILARQRAVCLRRRRTRSLQLRRKAVRKITHALLFRCFCSWRVHAKRSRYIHAKFMEAMITSARQCMETWKQYVSHSLLEKRGAARTVQSAWRGKKDREFFDRLHRRRMQQMRREHNRQQKIKAAGVIQRWIREMMSARRAFQRGIQGTAKKLGRARLKVQRIIKIQSVARTYLARCAYFRLREYCAARKIQSMARGRAARKVFRKKIAENFKRYAITWAFGTSRAGAELKKGLGPLRCPPKRRLNKRKVKRWSQRRGSQTRHFDMSSIVGASTTQALYMIETKRAARAFDTFARTHSPDGSPFADLWTAYERKARVNNKTRKRHSTMPQYRDEGRGGGHDDGIAASRRDSRSNDDEQRHSDRREYLILPDIPL